MKILLVALNASYVHTNLAIRYLRTVLEEQGQKDWEIRIQEYSINEQLENIAGEIYEEKPDVIGFSCYIWNISLVLKLMRRLRPVLPRVYFLAGGPEVSFDPEELLKSCPELDAVLVGEGEPSLPKLFECWAAGSLPWDIPGLVWRFRKPLEHRNLEGVIPAGFFGKYLDTGTDLIVTNEKCAVFVDLNSLPNPYTQEENLQGRLVYVETSRGCPFNCQFCLSSTFQGIRYLQPEKFRLILRSLFEAGATTIKFVDRTFNARKQHAFQILDVFRQEAEKAKVPSPRAHCEMAGELLDQDWLDYLGKYPPGMIQLEIGVQSTYQPTLEAIRRPQKFALWQDKVKILQHTYNIPVHLDLIAGLPFEGWAQFQKSFDEVIAVRPNHLQLGFLKVLKGSGLWRQSAAYGLVYSPDPPYTILQTKDLSHEEILALARIEDLVEKYYNSGRFKNSLEYIFKNCASPFAFFSAFARYWQKKGWFKRKWNPQALFGNLWEFLTQPDCSSWEDLEPKEGALVRPNDFLSSNNFRSSFNSNYLGSDYLREALRFDYYLLERPGHLPAFLLPAQDMDLDREKEKLKEEIRSDPRWQELIPQAGKMDKRQWARATAVEYFAVDIPNCFLVQDEEPATEGAWYLFFYQGKERLFIRYN